MAKRDLGMQLSSMCSIGDLSHTEDEVCCRSGTAKVPLQRVPDGAAAVLLASGGSRSIAADCGRPRWNATLCSAEEVPSVPYPAR